MIWPEGVEFDLEGLAVHLDRQGVVSCGIVCKSEVAVCLGEIEVCARAMDGCLNLKSVCVRLDREVEVAVREVGRTKLGVRASKGKRRLIHRWRRSRSHSPRCLVADRDLWDGMSPSVRGWGGWGDLRGARGL